MTRVTKRSAFTRATGIGLEVRKVFFFILFLINFQNSAKGTRSFIGYVGHAFQFFRKLGLSSQQSDVKLKLLVPWSLEFSDASCNFLF